ncbi:HesB/YadR/YfhF family protein [Alkalihalobacterium chitinilyticum]|uniref:HesB/YadR/YfhF family protein n=1 Tax=Alkalihalobacterium chitinilyticum TaxID=2980103 RepID=A0ABT5VBG4_9BACI|nr:HesB/YadR/YfhF family protein [Alkalihalobacterium chitinilyticum]MDE5412791.1 HesB/YadR/YfhF family protein [Alkalihalobacterium chitinilyticum]
MSIEVTKPAYQWFKDEFNLEGTEYMRIFVRYGGCGSFQQGFSLGIVKEEPKDAAIEVNMEGTIFFIEKEDMWYFDGKGVKIKYSRTKEEIEFVQA